MTRGGKYWNSVLMVLGVQQIVGVCLPESQTFRTSLSSNPDATGEIKCLSNTQGLSYDTVFIETVDTIDESMPGKKQQMQKGASTDVEMAPCPTIIRSVVVRL